MSLRVPPRVRDMPPPPFDAVLWDFDGTLVDSEPLWLVAEQGVAAELGGTLPPDYPEQVVGSALLDAAEVLLSYMPARTLTPAQVVDRFVTHMGQALREREIPWRPGAEHLLRDLREHGVPTALVSASWRGILEPVVERLPWAFDTIVAGEDVTHGKPHPEPYLRAAETLGVDPARCLVVEDSPTGAAAGSAAGCTVLVVPNIVAPPHGPRQIRADSLEGLDTAALSDLWRARATR